MIETNRNQNFILNEFTKEDSEKWFSFRQKKFLHNIDTFYYSVEFENDFREKSSDKHVHAFRQFFKIKNREMKTKYQTAEFYLPEFGKNLILRPQTFSRFYTICMSVPEYFDIFWAPVVPPGSDGGESVTPQCIVQIRSYMLWQFSAQDCFENSYSIVESIARFFNLTIKVVNENRVDYCWHSNYLQNPEKFFEMENFHHMRVDRFRKTEAIYAKVGSDDYEIDYVAMGKRSDKVFVRIYQKTREVIEQNYKGWFFQVWKMNGLISNYDLYVYEKCYQKRSWHYRFYARLEFYAEYGHDPAMVQRCREILDGSVTIEEDHLIQLADMLTPKLNYIINVEFQTMRRHSKSYELIPFHDYGHHGVTKRIYQYLDNRKLITDYLTMSTLRLVNYDKDIPKSKREMCPFWVALRRTKSLDVHKTPEGARLIRNYNRKLSAEAVKKRFISSAITYGLYTRGNNTDSVLQDAFEAILRMNDNDIKHAVQMKNERLRRFNADDLAEVSHGDCNYNHQFRFLDQNTGALYDYNNLAEYNSQHNFDGGDLVGIDWDDI